MRSLLDALRRVNRRLKRLGQGYMLILATVVGIVGGYGAIAFRWLIHVLQGQLWLRDAFSADYIRSLPWYWVVGVPALGGLVAGAIVFRFAPEAGGHGVPEVMAAMALRGGRIRPRTVIAKFCASSVTIASGGSVGREGPIVQIGAAAASTFGQIFHLSPRRLRTLVACGAAAGISATFNAPVAGALFAVEILLGDFGVRQFSPIVVAAVVATVVSRHYLGDTPTFHIPEHSLNHPVELVAYVVLGVVVAVVAVAFIRTLDRMETWVEESSIPLPVTALAGGAIVGLIALVFPGVLGVGYEEMNLALKGQSAGTYLAILLLAKALAVSITLASGGSGGVFAPSLFMGAAAGGAVAGAAQLILGPEIVQPGAYALVGMGAMVAATTHAPLTAMLVIFELTADYRIILPLMLSCVIGSLLAARLHGDSIYTSKLSRRGIRIRGGRAVNVLAKIPASRVIDRNVPTVGPDERLPELIQRLVSQESGCIYVVDSAGRYEGVVTLNGLGPAVNDATSMRDLLVARDVASLDGPRAAPDDTLDTVLGRLAAGYRDEIPVLEGDRLVGAIRTEDVLGCYRRELLRHEMAASFCMPASAARDESSSHRMGDFTVGEHSAPQRFWGKTLAELDFRRRYDVTVLLVRRGDAEDEAEPELPSADYRIEPTDRLVVFGKDAAVRRLLGS